MTILYGGILWSVKLELIVSPPILTIACFMSPIGLIQRGSVKLIRPSQCHPWIGGWRCQSLGRYVYRISGTFLSVIIRYTSRKAKRGEKKKEKDETKKTNKTPKHLESRRIVHLLCNLEKLATCGHASYCICARNAD